ncbi:MAG: RNA polymerase sigma factor [Caldilineaceae bacterium]
MTFDIASPLKTENEVAVLVSRLFEEYAGQICAYIHSLVGDWDLAHDLTQETYLRLFRARLRLPQIENQRAWLYRIATRTTFNELKRRKRFAWLPWHKADERLQYDWMAGVETEVEHRELVSRALAMLSTNYRAPLILYDGHGFSIREIAETLEISEGAVKTRLHRAREQFQRFYEQVSQP